MGFQHMAKDKAAAIQKKGGAAGGHRFAPGETAARKAGKKGGAAVSGEAKEEAGRKGARVKHARRKAQTLESLRQATLEGVRRAK